MAPSSLEPEEKNMLHVYKVNVFTKVGKILPFNSLNTLKKYNDNNIIFKYIFFRNISTENAWNETQETYFTIN